MGFNSFLRSPKREEEQVPDDIEFKETYGDEDIDFMDGILGIEDDEDQQLSGDNINNVYDDRFNWDFMDWDEFQDDDDEEEKGEQKKKQVSNKAVKKEESIGFWDEDDKKVALNLNLNYQDVLDAWSNRGTLWTDDCSLSMPNNTYMGEVPVLEEEKSRREASVLRYKEKRQTRLFSKKIRYQVRKLNADKRPRLKGRFVKRVVPEKMLK